MIATFVQPLSRFQSAWLALLGLLLACVASTLAADAPYAQIQAERYTFKGSKLADWAQLPIASGVQLSPMTFSFGNAMWLLSTDGIFSWSSQGGSGGGVGTFVLVTVQQLPAPLTLDTRVLSLGPNAAAIIGPSGFATVQCTSATACAAKSWVPFAFGSVTALALAGGGNVVYIGSSKGLFHTGPGPITQDTIVDGGVTSLAWNNK